MSTYKMLIDINYVDTLCVDKARGMRSLKFSGDEGAIPFAGAATSAGVESPTVLPETEDELLRGVLASVPLPAPAFRTCYRFPYLWEDIVFLGVGGSLARTLTSPSFITKKNNRLKDMGLEDFCIFKIRKDRELMPINPEKMKLYPGGGTYSKEWKTFRTSLLVRAENRCEGTPMYPDCRAENGRDHPVTGSKVVLTIAHMDHDETHADPERCRALCQKCHLSWDAKHHAKNAAITRRRKSLQIDIEDFIEE